MLRFFRQIRQRLLVESNFRKYILYAVGEIVLVVVGILIALQINNWNEERKTRNAELLILKDIKAEIEANTLLLKQVIEQDELSFNANEGLYKIMLDPNLFDSTNDSIFNRLLGRMITTWTYEAELGMVNSVINSGKIEYITNKELKIRLTSLNAKVEDAIEATDYLTELRTPLFLSLYSQSFIPHETKGWVVSKEKYRNSQFFYWTKAYKGLKSGAIAEEKVLLDYLFEILAIIDAEIEIKQ